MINAPLSSRPSTPNSPPPNLHFRRRRGFPASTPQNRLLGPSFALYLSAFIALLFFISAFFRSGDIVFHEAYHDAAVLDLQVIQGAASSGHYQALALRHDHSHKNWLPQGAAVARPVVNDPSVNFTSTDVLRLQRDVGYGGGQGDPMHLGGFAKYGSSTISPTVWKHMIEKYNIKSVLDVGCGRGWSTLWFLLHGVDAVCVEGSRDAIRQTVIPKAASEDAIVEHDYTLGSWWPEKTVDAVWAADFVVQVSLPFQSNYMASFKSAAIIILTAPRLAGWHYVQIHQLDWWIIRMEMYGLIYNSKLTEEIRSLADLEKGWHKPSPDGSTYLAKSILDAIVFINPSVASQPEHAHLFSEMGCFKDRLAGGVLVQRECGVNLGVASETKLSPEYYPIKLNIEMDEAWDEAVRSALNPNEVKLLTPEIQAILDNTPLNLSISDHPIFKLKPEHAKGNTAISKVPVVVWPYFEFGIGNSESLHIEERGILESKFLELSNDVDNFHPNVVWVGDTGYAYGWQYWCSKFNEHVRRAKMKRASLGLPLQWPIFIVDFTDGTGRQRCHNIEKEVGIDFVTYSERAIVSRRGWDEKKGWVKTGVLNPRVWAGKYYRHSPLVVRTDTIENLYQVLKSRGMKLSDPIESINREVDVTHLWPLELDKVGSVHSNLRSKVSTIIANLGKENNMTVYVGLAGDPVQTGRRGVKSNYIEALLRTKIIVITQRDEWEDHYRLFEGLISGAMVMTDRMLSMPEALLHRESVVEFESADDLKEKIRYYLQHPQERLAIAREGRRRSMNRHRAWHRIEEIIFGQPMTICTGRPDSDCPYIVHTNETMRR